MSKDAMCAGAKECTGPLAFVDRKGWVYCDKHGAQSAGRTGMRKLRQIDVTRIEAGLPVTWSTKE